MRHSGFFSAITKYPPSTLSNPRENRLTEVFAAVLAEVDSDFTVQLVKNWLNESDANPGLGERAGLVDPTVLASIQGATSVEVETQLLLHGGFVDLELRFGDDEPRTPIRRVRVEAKHGTEPANGQVKRYEERVDSVPTVPVVILAPAHDLPFEDSNEAPETAPQRSWEGVSRIVREYIDRDQSGEKESWLLKELLEFLREEGLVPVERMLKEHTDALAVRQRADDVFRALLASARRRIDEEWGANESMYSGGGDGLKFEKHYPHSSHNDEEWWLPDGGWLEFKISGPLDVAVETSGDLHFIAGLSWRPRTMPDIPEDALVHLQELGFARFREGSCERLMRISSPSDFLLADRGGEAKIEDQGRDLGDWVIGAFTDVNRVVRGATG